MKTYKYLGKIASECFLKDLTVRFSQPKAFNDPFELQPEFHLTKSCRKINYDVSRNFVLNSEESLYKKYIINNRPSRTQVRKVDSKRIFDQLNERIGILCLTQAETILPSNQLMWSHYSESHQGLVIEFEGDSEFISASRSVHYFPRRPILSAKLLSDNDTIPIDDLYFKSSDWNYENESRITKALSECINTGLKDVMGNPIYVSEIPTKCIKTIYLGCNSSDTLKALAYKLYESHRINIVFLRVHDEEYKLVPSTNLGDPYSKIFLTNRSLLTNRETI